MVRIVVTFCTDKFTDADFCLPGCKMPCHSRQNDDFTHRQLMWGYADEGDAAIHYDALLLAVIRQWKVYGDLKFCSVTMYQCL